MESLIKMNLLDEVNQSELLNNNDDIVIEEILEDDSSKVPDLDN